MPDNLPLYEKFVIRRCDGRDRVGEKHRNCRYFVLDLDHDPFAASALLAYGEACMMEFPALGASVLREARGEKQTIMRYGAAAADIALGRQRQATIDAEMGVHHATTAPERELDSQRMTMRPGGYTKLIVTNSDRPDGMTYAIDIESRDGHARITWGDHVLFDNGLPAIPAAEQPA